MMKINIKINIIRMILQLIIKVNQLIISIKSKKHQKPEKNVFLESGKNIIYSNNQNENKNNIKVMELDSYDLDNDINDKNMSQSKIKINNNLGNCYDELEQLATEEIENKKSNQEIFNNIENIEEQN